MRPIPITILCGLLFTAGALKLVLMVALALAQSPLNIGLAIQVVVIYVAYLVSILGLWHMRRWGVYLFLGLYLVTAVAFYASPAPTRGSGLALTEAFRPDNPLLPFLQQRPWLVFLGRFTWLLIYCAVVLPYWKRLQPMKRVVATPCDGGGGTGNR